MNNSIVAALLGLAASLKPAYYQSGAPKGRGNEHTIHHKSGATRRGFVHTIGKSFRSRQIKGLTPAMYRREHMGIVHMLPNYKKPHPKPLWRNRWISA